MGVTQEQPPSPFPHLLWDQIFLMFFGTARHFQGNIFSQSCARKNREGSPSWVLPLCWCECSVDPPCFEGDTPVLVSFGSTTALSHLTCLLMFLPWRWKQQSCFLMCWGSFQYALDVIFARPDKMLLLLLGFFFF